MNQLYGRVIGKNFIFYQKSKTSFKDIQPAFTCSKLTIETLITRREICSKLTIKASFGVFIVNFEHISQFLNSVCFVLFVFFKYVIVGWFKSSKDHNFPTLQILVKRSNSTFTQQTRCLWGTCLVGSLVIQK